VHLRQFKTAEGGESSGAAPPVGEKNKKKHKKNKQNPKKKNTNQPKTPTKQTKKH